MSNLENAHSAYLQAHAQVLALVEAAAMSHFAQIWALAHSGAQPFTAYPGYLNLQLAVRDSAHQVIPLEAVVKVSQELSQSVYPHLLDQRRQQMLSPAFIHASKAAVVALVESAHPNAARDIRTAARQAHTGRIQAALGVFALALCGYAVFELTADKRK